MATNTITVKQGATIRWAAVWRDAAGATVDLTGRVITCQLRDEKGRLVGVLAATLGNQVSARGTFELYRAATPVLPAGPLEVDIAAALPGGDVEITQSFNLLVTARVTQ